MSSLEREAKENVYAVLDPHIQYDITINKHGEPPKYLSLSKPLTHQRTHAFNPQNIVNEINNNDNRFTTFKAGPPKIRRSNKSNQSLNTTNHPYTCKTNNDIEYLRDPFFGMNRTASKGTEAYAQSSRHNENRSSKKHSRMYERNNSGRLGENNLRNDFINNSRRASNRSWRDKLADANKEREGASDEIEREKEVYEDFKPRPGKVKEIASRFNRNSNNQSSNFKKERPKPLNSYGNQAYLDHVFPDAIEI